MTDTEDGSCCAWEAGPGVWDPLLRSLPLERWFSNHSLLLIWHGYYI